MNKYILLYPPNETALVEFVKYSKVIKENSKYIPVMFIENKLVKFTESLNQLDIDYLLDKEDILINNGKVSLSHSTRDSRRHSSLVYNFLKKRMKFFVPTLVFFVFDFLKTMIETLYKKIRIEKILKQKKYEAVLLYSDRMIGWEQVIISYFKKRNLPRIILPVAISSVEGGLRLRNGKKQYVCDYNLKTPLINRFIRLINSKWCYKDEKDNRIVSFYTPAKALTGILFKNISMNPWFNGGGYSTLIAVDSEKSFNSLVQGGISRDKIVIAGSLSQDEIFEAYSQRDNLKNSMIKIYNLNHRREIVILAMPQLAEHNLVSWEDNYKTNSEIVEALSKTGLNVLISLHPKSNIKDYIEFEKMYKCKILTEKLSKILPIADYFIASYSSTIMWAIQCNIPSFVVDFFDFNYSLFDEYEIVSKSKSIEDFMICFNKVVNDNGHKNHILLSNKINSFDNKNASSKEMILKILEEQIGE